MRNLKDQINEIKVSKKLGTNSKDSKLEEIKSNKSHDINNEVSKQTKVQTPKNRRPKSGKSL